MDDDGRALLGSTLTRTSTDALVDLAAGTGVEVLRAVLEQVRAGSGADVVFVGEIRGENLDRVEVLAAVDGEGAAAPFAYKLLGTPCQRVVAGEVCAYPEGVAARFPDDGLLVDMGIEGYCGVRLADAGERPLGLVVALSRRPLAADAVAVTAELLDAWSGRLTVELEHRRLLRDLRGVLEITGTSGPDAVGQVTRGLAGALGVTGAFVIRLAAGRPRLVALTHPRGSSERVQIDPAETLERLAVRALDGASEAHPAHPILRVTGGRAVVSELLVEGERPVGVFGLLDDRRFIESLAHGPVFDACRNRITVELLRMEHEERRGAAEQALLRVQRRQSLDVLVGGVAHDLNNLLLSATANVEFARSLRPEPEPEADEAEADALLALRTAAELARGLLRLGGPRDEAPNELDLREIVQDVLRMTRSAVPAGVRVQVGLPEEAAGYHGRRAELVQLVMNLVVNAAQALPDGQGRLGLRLELAAGCGALEGAVALLEPTEAPLWCLEVEDDGVGIPREVLGHIMDPRVSSKADGHGLGLAAARGVLERVGGGLVVRSAPGRGSCFRVLLPQRGETLRTGPRAVG